MTAYGYAAYVANLNQRRMNISAELAAMDSTTPGGKPDTVGGSGANIKHIEYRNSLIKELEEIDKALLESRAVDASIAGDACWEISS